MGFSQSLLPILQLLDKLTDRQPSGMDNRQSPGTDSPRGGQTAEHSHQPAFQTPFPMREECPQMSCAGLQSRDPPRRREGAAPEPQRSAHPEDISSAHARASRLPSLKMDALRRGRT